MRLGATINLISLSVFKQLGIGKLAPTTVIAIGRPFISAFGRKLEDALVKVDKFILLTDFIILDYEVDKDVNDQKMKFNILKAMKYPDKSNACHAIELEEDWPYKLESETNKAMEKEKDEMNAQ
ncbi:uncharacterized protein LOC120067632 [Benincasa hispida]|uniref:uncharacterized protein LOC120067632 n=1 Tax=Benincasa hispida TaxID=102211 RepID=UPI0019024127|nr:uncharacterized protein LOC120067632 [Benincasa hispida]